MIVRTNTNVFTLAYGKIVLEWPERISREDVEDVEQWFALIVRRIKRDAEKPVPEKSQEE